MTKKQNIGKASGPATRVVSAEVFKQVYDSPQSLPGKEKWVTTDADVRAIERLLGIPQKNHWCSVMGKRRYQTLFKVHPRNELVGYCLFSVDQGAWQRTVG